MTPPSRGVGGKRERGGRQRRGRTEEEGRRGKEIQKMVRSVNFGAKLSSELGSATH